MLVAQVQPMVNGVRPGTAQTVVALGLLGFSAGCLGIISDGGGNGNPRRPIELICEGESGPGMGVSPLQPLTKQQIASSTRFLFSGIAEPGLQEALGFLPPDGRAGGFPSNAEVPSDLSAIDGTQIFAEKAAVAAMAAFNTWRPCDPADGEAACASTIVRTLGRRTYRRSLTDEETTKLDALFAAGKALGSFSDGVHTLVEALLQSPSFLFRIEEGKPTDVQDVYQLTGTELASRLSFMLWAAPPDDALLDRAEAGDLDAPEGLTLVVRDMLTDNRAKQGMVSFHDSWLGIEHLLEEPKDPAVHPDYTPQLARDMLTETHEYVYNVILQNKGNLEALLTSPVSYVNSRLATHYGMNADGLTTDAFVQRPAPEHRGGLLSQASILTSYSRDDNTTVIFNGKMIREKFLCQTMPEPPPGNQDGNIDRMVTQPCAGCHVMMDPIGFGFQRFDGIGKVQSGAEVDAMLAQATLNSAGDITGPFASLPELSGKLASYPAVSDCISKYWVTYLLQRIAGDDDQCNVEHVQKTFKDSDYTIEELIVAALSSDLYRYRRRDN